MHRSRLAAVAAALALPLYAGEAHAAPTTRDFSVEIKFWKATVAGVNTIAVTNLPSDFAVYAGDSVRFFVKNSSPIPEGFSIDAYKVREVLQPNQSRTITVRNLTPGSYVIYCQLHPFSVHYIGHLLVLPKQT